MPKYLCIQRSQKRTSDTPPPEKPSPEKMQKMMLNFKTWQDKYQSQIVDMGGPLAGGSKVVTSDSVTEGPHDVGDEVAGGFMIVEADNIEDAAQLAQESPGVMAPGSSVEVREIRSMQG